MKSNTNISLDTEIKKEAMEILNDKGYTLSFYVEQVLRKVIKEDERRKIE